MEFEREPHPSEQILLQLDGFVLACVIVGHAADRRIIGASNNSGNNIVGVYAVLLVSRFVGLKSRM